MSIAILVNITKSVCYHDSSFRQVTWYLLLLICSWSNLITNLSLFDLSLHTAALLALKRKKRYEKQLTQIDGTLSTIEYQREALENANTNTEVLKNMSMAAKAMKHEHEKV